MRQEQIERLQNSVKYSIVPKQNKVLYNFAMWVITNAQKNELSYGKLQQKVCNMKLQDKGWFRNYYAKHYQGRPRTSYTRDAKYWRDHQKKLRTIYNLYKQGKLSEHSSNMITRKIKKEIK